MPQTEPAIESPRCHPKRPQDVARRHLPVLLFCISYSAAAWLLFVELGLVAQLDEVVFHSYDSGGYLDLANFFVGRAELADTSLLEVRPFAYPLFLATHFYVGLGGFVFLQWCASFVSVAATFASVRFVTRSQRCGLIACLVLVLQPTFGFITLHALTESLALAFLSVAVYFIIRSREGARARWTLLATFFLAAASVTKPIYTAFLLIWLLYSVVALARGGLLSTAHWMWAPVALAPVLVQLTLTFHLLGFPPPSGVGPISFETRFFSAVYGFQTEGEFASYRSEQAVEAGRAFPELPVKLRFVLAHPVAAGRAAWYIFSRNLTAPSSFVLEPKSIVGESRLARAIYAHSDRMSTAIAVLHAAGICCVVAVLLRSRRDAQLATVVLLACLTASTLALTTLTYWQGDRLVLGAAPAWIVLYADLLARAARRATAVGSAHGGVST